MLLKTRALHTPEHLSDGCHIKSVRSSSRTRRLAGRVRGGVQREGALVMLTQAWAAEMGKYNVYAVRPGYLLTKLSAGQPDSAGSIVSATPLGRGGGYDINGPEVTRNGRGDRETLRRPTTRAAGWSAGGRGTADFSQIFWSFLGLAGARSSDQSGPDRRMAPPRTQTSERPNAPLPYGLSRCLL
jgi:hypothetical protein